jgi:uncharacterized protein YlxP (DUF503 family)
MPADPGGEAPCALPAFADSLGYDPSDEPVREAGEALHFAVTVGLMEADLRLPLCRSLKEKRGILAKTMNHLRKKHAVSVAEVAAHDSWGRAGLAIVTVSGAGDVAERTLRAVAHTLEKERDLQLVSYAVELL